MNNRKELLKIKRELIEVALAKSSMMDVEMHSIKRNEVNENQQEETKENNYQVKR